MRRFRFAALSLVALSTLASGVIVSACGSDAAPIDGADASGPSCDAGAEVVACGSTCVNTQSDPNHCGTCEKACAATEVCRSGECESVCQLDGKTVNAGAINPANACTHCDPALSSDQWSSRPNGTACDTGEICANGTCAAQCYIDGNLRAADAVNPDDACQACEPTVSTIAWTARPNGTSCAGGEICESGVCSATCNIGGMLYAANTANPANACEQCNPATSTTAWSVRADGAGCGAGEVCESGACTAKCYIDGAFYAADAANPANVCEQCTPATSTTAWSAGTDGTSCGAGKVCESGACNAKCYIDGTFYAINALNPANACQQCTPGTSTSAWSSLADGASCGAGLVCEATTCSNKCYINGTFYVANAANPANDCEQCTPATSTTTFSSRASVTLLMGGTDIAAQGWSTASVGGPASLTYGSDYVRLATATTTGATTSGQMLLQYPGVGAGQPFTIQVVMLVESVNPHNPSDSAAAILGSFTPPFGSGVERQQMIYLDSAAIGWADDSQSSAFNVLDGAYHTYELSVDAANVAHVRVDGIATLTRNGFVSNGTIAIGDQTNEPNLDGVVRIRSVTKICP